ncbi:hypothetical protein FLJC2902T_28550 [Flavobacterium limnosediminis JC2902]|uniref:Uncharacterized protein n=1 Tax=Flavobacterium limnosediminis JC2902 TaxID=1341181 RepID=V6SIT9_9FLAO|nr:hypothetical protein [Flavobacterium limnosediminis]ESU26369.1 hypothetical protein FLJC2902T_28550 [Flavobacterium limnosediminis JC2902]
MTENTDTGDEISDNLLPLEPEKTNDNKEPDTITTKENETMEAHPHVHHNGKKNWKAYFWEFLMLFLAVFCGFLAEYRLEHVIEHNREEVLMYSLTEDLQTDYTQLETYIGWRTETDGEFDSIVKMLAKPTRDENTYHLYKFTNNATLRFGLPDISERTILQLKNAGGLRLIRNKAVSNAINKHYMNVNRMKSTYETERFVRLKLLDSRANLFDASVFIQPEIPREGIKLMTNDYVIINHFMSDVLAAKQLNKRLIGELDQVKKSSAHLKQLIEKEYPIK